MIRQGGKRHSLFHLPPAFTTSISILPNPPEAGSEPARRRMENRASPSTERNIRAIRWTSRLVRPKKAASRTEAGGSWEPPASVHSLWFQQEAGGVVRKKKPMDPVRRAQKDRGYRIGWLIALAGIVCGFALVALRSA